jgi:hypothetical protein
VYHGLLLVLQLHSEHHMDRHNHIQAVLAMLLLVLLILQALRLVVLLSLVFLLVIWPIHGHLRPSHIAAAAAAAAADTAVPVLHPAQTAPQAAVAPLETHDLCVVSSLPLSDTAHTLHHMGSVYTSVAVLVCARGTHHTSDTPLQQLGALLLQVR